MSVDGKEKVTSPCRILNRDDAFRVLQIAVRILKVKA